VLQKGATVLIANLYIDASFEWGLTDYLPIHDFQCHCPLLCPEFVGKQERGHRVQEEDRKKSGILLLFVIQLRTSFMSGI
jgi:hypothetical protein